MIIAMLNQIKKIILIGFISFIGLIGFIGYLKIKSLPALEQTNGLTNVLLLGVAGGAHDGSDLTDTMILFSFNQGKQKAELISLPRDIWSETLKAKINSAYHYGEEKQKAGGLILSKSIVEEITGLPVHYAAKINLSGLDDMVNLIGGVEINIDRGFEDFKYPIEGKESDDCGNTDPEYSCRYQHLSFAVGQQVLNGEKALQYVRSRNAEGEEGSDFSRSKRQQKLLMAIKEKLLQPSFFLNKTKISSLLQILKISLETDFPQNQIFSLGKEGVKTLMSKKLKIESLNLEEFLISPPLWQYGQWVLIPKTGDFQEIQNYLKEKTSL